MARALSSVYGEISRLLLTYPEAAAWPGDIVLQRYEGIFQALGPGVEYVVLAYPEAHEGLRNTARRAGLIPEALRLVGADAAPFAAVRRLLRPLSDGSYEAIIDSPFHSIWAQDAYAVVVDEGGSTLLEPLGFTRGGDHFIAEQIAAHTDLRIETTRYHLEGGNVLTGSDYALVGVDYLFDNMQMLQESAEQVTEGIRAALGIEHLVWVGDGDPLRFPIFVFEGRHQPIFHIDMYLTLGGGTPEGKELVFVGDPALAKRLLGHAPPPGEISAAFDRAAAQLAAYDGPGPRFDVVRLPLDLWDDAPGSGRATFLTYNNGLVEVTEEGRRVCLPSYSSVAPGSRNRRRLDEAIEEIFAGRGFTVTWMSGAYHELCKRGGSLHCITKALARTG